MLNGKEWKVLWLVANFLPCGLWLNFQRACRKWLPFYFVGMVHNTWTMSRSCDSCMNVDSYVGVDSNYFRGELPS